MTELGSGFVVLMGMGTVFFGLVCIVFLCWLMSLILKGSAQTPAAPAQPQRAPVAAAAPTIEMQPAEKQQVAAAISTAIAEQMGTDVAAIRIVSIRKL